MTTLILTQELVKCENIGGGDLRIGCILPKNYNFGLMADEVVEIVSSDDEIGNYNGIPRRQSEDDIVLVEPSTVEQNYGVYQPSLPWSLSSTSEKKRLAVTNISHNDCSLPKKRYIPVSSSRQEIKSIIRNSTQVTMSQFLNEASGDKRKREVDASSESSSTFKKQRVADEPQTASLSSAQDEEVQCVTSDLREGAERASSHQKDQSIALNSNSEKQDHESRDESETSKASVSEFIKKWTSLKGMLDRSDKKIEDKIWKYYYLAHTSFTHSKTFLKNVEEALRRMNTDNVYVLIKDFLDCLKSYKDVPFNEATSCDPQAPVTTEQPQPATKEDAALEKKLRKIEKTMKKLDEQIKQLDETEVDLDDDDNSAYLVQERLKMQFMKLDDYYCKLAGCSRSTGRPVEKRFRYDGSRYPEINQRISAWINKHREFPDYHDVLNLVKKVTDDSALPLRPETVRVQAQEIFRDVGKMLKERRENDDLFSIYSYCDIDGPDPAALDPELASTLDENARVASERLVKVFQEYVDKEAELRESADKKADAKKSTTDDETTERDSRPDSEDCRAEEEQQAKEKKNSNENCGRREICNINSHGPQELPERRPSNEGSDNEPYFPIVQQEIVFDDGRGAGGGNGWTNDSDDDRRDNLGEVEVEDDEDEEEIQSVCSSLPDIELGSSDVCNANELSSTGTVNQLVASNLKLTPTLVDTSLSSDRAEDDGSSKNAANLRSASPRKANTKNLSVLNDKSHSDERVITSPRADALQDLNKQNSEAARLVDIKESESDASVNPKSNGLLVCDDVGSMDELERSQNHDKGVDSLERTSCHSPKNSPPGSLHVGESMHISSGKLSSPKSKKCALDRVKLLQQNGTCTAKTNIDKLISTQTNENVCAKIVLASTLTSSDAEKERNKFPAVADSRNADLKVISSDSHDGAKNLVSVKTSIKVDRNGNTDSDPVSDAELSVVSCHFTSEDNHSSDVHSSEVSSHRETRSDVSAASHPISVQLSTSSPHSTALKSSSEQLLIEGANETNNDAVLDQLPVEDCANSLGRSSIARHDDTPTENSGPRDIHVALDAETTFHTPNSDSVPARAKISTVNHSPPSAGGGIGNEGTAAVVTLEPSTESDDDATPSKPPWSLSRSSHSNSSDEVLICEEGTPFLSQNVELKREAKLNDVYYPVRSPSWLTAPARRSKVRTVTPILPVPNGRHHQPSSPELVEID